MNPVLSLDSPRAGTTLGSTREAIPGEALDGREDQRKLGLEIIRGSRLGAGAGRLAANIDNICSVGYHAFCLGYGRIDIAAESVTGKGIRGEVTDAHDVGLFPPAKEGFAAAGGR